MFIIETISLLTLKNEEWTFLPRYVCSALVLALGFIAPGITSNYEEDNQINNNVSEQETPFDWTEVGKKLRIILRFIWPRNNFDIQLKLLFCVMLLITERLTRLLVPIYNQKIGEFIF